MLHEQIRNHLTTNPDANAIEYKQRWVTRKHVMAIIKDIDRLLNNAALGEGAPVVTIARNMPCTAAAIVGLIMTRRCVLPVMPFQSAQRIVEDIRELNAPAIIAAASDWETPGLIDIAIETGALGIKIADDGTSVELVPGTETLGLGPFHEAMQGIAIRMTTSGTTGRPKRVNISYHMMETNALNWQKLDTVQNNGQQLDAQTLTIILHNPIIHISGMMFLIQGFFNGQQICLIEKFNVPEWHDAVLRFRPKYPGLPPTGVRMVLDAKIPKEDLSSLAAVRVGTAPLDESTRARWENTYGIPLLTNYGATEFASPVTQWRLEDYVKFGKTKPGSVGNPAPDTLLRIVDMENGKELKTGEIGLLEVKALRFGPAVDWLRTTDLASLDDDGFLYIHGRADQAIIRGGFKILPENVTAVLTKHVKVMDAAVIGIPDERLGAVPVAAIEPHSLESMPTEEELKDFLREHLTAYQVPVKILICQKLPRTPSMKLDLGTIKTLFMP